VCVFSNISFVITHQTSFQSGDFFKSFKVSHQSFDLLNSFFLKKLNIGLLKSAQYFINFAPISSVLAVVLAL